VPPWEFRPPHAIKFRDRTIRSRSSATPTASWSGSRAELLRIRRGRELSEANYAAVQYIPRKDVDMTLLERTDRATYCPTRGTAPITAFRSGRAPVNAVWSYEDPLFGSHVDQRPPRLLSDRVDAIEEQREAKRFSKSECPLVTGASRGMVARRARTRE